ncbi:MAG: NAD(P)/FAD-dependent oxidoreductase [Acidimicrobiales bacterium]|nr:NAD(P)/FAD-dependent oxidoreductase [Hyphomonadaceae bacterium]RZV41042.1 MAG: NAD(P)/FAD-dependent oxidoreductase [Acidimicrobiales bacterium]
MSKSFEAVIIGGGHNGLVCSYYLARKGLKTLVLERSAVVGGAAITEEFHPGFRNSVASYTVSLLNPKVIKDMGLKQHGLEIVLRKVDNFLPLGDDYMLSGRGGLTLSEIARHSKKDAEAYPRYEKALSDIVDCIRKFLLVAPPNAGGGLADVLSLIRSANIMRKTSLATQRNLLDFFTKSAGEILEQYFESDAVKALYGFDAIVGHFASPYEPGTAYVLLHHVFGEVNGVNGAWGHAIGGMGAITRAMQRACEEAGVEIRTETSVEEILTVDGKAVGVKTAEGEITAKIVSASVHPKVLYQHLVDPGVLATDFKTRIDNYKSHSGTFRMNVALDKLPEFTSRTNAKGADHLTAGIIIAPSLAYMDKAWTTAHARGWSDQPIVEMLIPSTLDTTLAPEGKHVASLFCQQFNYDLPKGMSWESERFKVADQIINTVNKHAPGFSNAVVGRQVLSPLDIEQKLGLVRGDIFHGRMSLDQLFSARPVLGHGSYRAPIKGLYMCGSGTHPGGGVTGVPGHNAAHIILKDRKKFR